VTISGGKERERERLTVALEKSFVDELERICEPENG